MSNKHRLHIQTALIIVIFLMGHISVLLHATEHPFHNEVESCQTFTALEKSKNALISDCSTVDQLVASFNKPPNSTSLIFSITSNTYHIRAPPLSPSV